MDLILVCIVKQRTAIRNMCNMNSISFSFSGVCTFEGADICRWYVDTSKQLKWQRGSSSTPSTKTGPSSDHTYGTAQGLLHSCLLY